MQRLYCEIKIRVMERIGRLDDWLCAIPEAPPSSTIIIIKCHSFEVLAPENDPCFKYVNILNHCLGCWRSHSSFDSVMYYN